MAVIAIIFALCFAESTARLAFFTTKSKRKIVTQGRLYCYYSTKIGRGIVFPGCWLCNNWNNSTLQKKQYPADEGGKECERNRRKIKLKRWRAPVLCQRLFPLWHVVPFTKGNLRQFKTAVLTTISVSDKACLFVL